MICQALTILLNALEMMAVSFFETQSWILGEIGSLAGSSVQLDEISRCHGSEIDKALGIPGQNFAAGGLLVDLLDRVHNLPDPCSGFICSFLGALATIEVIEGTF